MDAAVRLFEGVAPENQKFRDTLRPVVLQWLETCDWFMDRTHDSGATDADIEIEELRKRFGIFESTLLTIVRGFSTFFANTDELDEYLRGAPSPEHVDATVARLGHGEYNRYFFDRLANPDWIPPLKLKGFFSSPPKPIRDETRGTIAFPHWPESRYLFRMAKSAPETVLGVVLEIPDTENIRVHDDLADIALTLPGPLAAKLVPQAKTWIQTPYELLLPEKLGALVSKLTQEGEAGSALDLARAVLEVLPDPKPIILVPEPRARFDAWNYERILRKDIPQLVKAVGMPALTLVCDLLDRAVTLGQKDNQGGGPEDYSSIWRPAIEYGRDSLHGVADVLTSAVRDCAEELVTEGIATTAEVIQALEKRRWQIFHRIELHVLRRFADRAPDLVAERLREPARFDYSGIVREYSLLAKEQFGHLDTGDKDRILAWIEAGPDLENFKARWGRFTGQAVSDEDARRYAKGWRRDRLTLFLDHLPEDWKVRYQELVREIGQPNDLIEARQITGGAFAPASPKSSDDLSKMSIPEMIAYLRSWQPSNEPFGEKIAGLASELGAIVAADPSRLASEAQRFKNLDPTYVREFLYGFSEPAKKKIDFDWKEILALCQWATGQPPTIHGQKGGLFDRDPDWGWTRSTIARLLSTGFEADAVPIELRREAWEIVEQLTEDPSPTAEDEARYLGKDKSDPSSLSINSTRGEAMHNVIQYALWIRRDFEKRPNAKELTGRGFEEMPEVQRVLDRHLDAAIDPSLTSRSVYGRWLPWLHFLDGSWTEKNLAKIFPKNETLRKLWDCTWTTYVVHCEAYNNVFELLKSEYSFAVEHIGEHAFGGSHLGDPDERLANHLMTLYWRGKVSLTEENGLLQRFYAKAPDKLRGYSATFVGRSLGNEGGDVAPEIIERLKTLWTTRCTVASSATGTVSYVEEMGQFGWSFVSKKFDDDWAILQLAESLKIAKKTAPDHLVVERLANLSGRFPRKAVECLAMIVEGDLEGWGVLGWRDDARKVIAGAIGSGDVAARSAATNLAHRLGSRGYFEFKELLPVQPPEAQRMQGHG